MWMFALGLAGAELIFLLTAGTAVCFGFTVEFLLTAHWCFGCYVMLAVSQGLFGVSALPERSCTRSWGSMARAGQRDIPWISQRDIPWHTMLRTVHKHGERDVRAWSLLKMGWVWAGGEPVYWASLAFLGVFPLSFFLLLLDFKLFKLLNYSYLNPQILPFILIPLPVLPRGGRRGGKGMSEWLHRT